MQVPMNPQQQQTPSPLSAERPSPANLLMAAATMHQMGRLTEPEPEVKPSIRAKRRTQRLK